MKMKHKIIVIGLLIFVAVAAYYAGQIKSSFDSSLAQMNRDFEHWDQLAQLDRSFLTNVIIRPSSLISGRYVLEIRFPGEPPLIDHLDLVVSNGLIALPKSNKPHRNGMADTLAQNGNVVSWHYEGIAYEANAECVGLIDENMIWGRVYGWNPGNESIGIWKLYPQPEQ